LEDISLHLLDIAENSIEAGATAIDIVIDEDSRQNRLLLQIKDNGRGLDAETRRKVLDPFYTTKTTRRVGMGIPLLAQAAKEAQGNLTIDSREGKGTTLTAAFTYNHIDRKPLGNIAATLVTLIAGSGLQVDFNYLHRKNGEEFLFNTREIKAGLQEVPINNPEVLTFLKENLENGLSDLLKEDKTS
jgi:anti-sigma regulatory factor (Ser/Thr protein kinase)